MVVISNKMIYTISFEGITCLHKCIYHMCAAKNKFPHFTRSSCINA